MLMSIVGYALAGYVANMFVCFSFGIILKDKKITKY